MKFLALFYEALNSSKQLLLWDVIYKSAQTNGRKMMDIHPSKRFDHKTQAKTMTRQRSMFVFRLTSQGQSA